jgi:hypothetical protein
MQPDRYATSDFSSAVYLMANECQLLASERVTTNKVRFVFSNPDKRCEALLQRMLFDDHVSLSRALAEVRKLRTVIRSTT